MAEHTKTPWEICKMLNGGMAIKPNNGIIYIAIMTNHNVSQANAEHIITAVNAHEGLVTLKKAVEDFLDHEICGGYVKSTWEKCSVEALQLALQQALAAEGEL